jgi:hypothetical protein
VSDNIVAVTTTAEASSLDDVLERYLRAQPSSTGWNGSFSVDHLIGSDALWNASRSPLSEWPSTPASGDVAAVARIMWADYTSL